MQNVRVKIYVIYTSIIQGSKEISSIVSYGDKYIASVQHHATWCSGVLRSVRISTKFPAKFLLNRFKVYVMYRDCPEQLSILDEIVFQRRNTEFTDDLKHLTCHEHANFGSIIRSINRSALYRLVDDIFPAVVL